MKNLRFLRKMDQEGLWDHAHGNLKKFATCLNIALIALFYGPAQSVKWVKQSNHFSILTSPPTN